MTGRGRLVARATKQDPDDVGYALLDLHRKKSADALLAETEGLLAQGARVEEIVWLLTPNGASALLAADVVEGFESRGAHEFARSIAAAREGLEFGYCVCAYMGPEGHFFEWLRIEEDEGIGALPERAQSDTGDTPTGDAGFDAIARHVQTALRAALSDHRLELPLHAAFVGQGGGMFYVRFTATSEPGGIDAQPLALHSVGAALGRPVHMLFSDPQGRAVLATLREDGDGKASVVVSGPAATELPFAPAPLSTGFGGNEPPGSGGG